MEVCNNAFLKVASSLEDTLGSVLLYSQAKGTDSLNEILYYGNWIVITLVNSISTLGIINF